MSYIAYVTPWSEGTVVAHRNDKEFAIGSDNVSGGIQYKKWDELIKIQGFMLIAEFESPVDCRLFDTALYPRKR